MGDLRQARIRETIQAFCCLSVIFSLLACSQVAVGEDETGLVDKRNNSKTSSIEKDRNSKSSSTEKAKNSKSGSTKKVEAKTFAVVPVSRTDMGWMPMHEALMKKAKNGNIDFAFFGDSITEGMNEALLHKYFGAKAEHFGIGGDLARHLLWRLQNGELDFTGQAPKTIVVLIGTNDISEWEGHPSSPNEEIRDGVNACLKEIRKQLPKTKIILLGLIPRDEKPSSPIRKRVNETNVLLKTLADKKHIWYLDIGPKMLEPDGTLSKDIMPDFLHPSQIKGYDLMFKSIKSELEALHLH